MANYTTLPNYDENIYIIEIDDPIGSGVDGADSKPNIDIGDNSSYFKKHHSALIIGTTPPSGNYGLYYDSNATAQTLYYDKTTCSFWKWYGGTTWSNITANVILNINGIKINFNSDEDNYVKMQYIPVVGTGENSYIHVSDIFNNNQHIKINRLSAQMFDGNSYVQAGITDSEIMVNSDIQNENENGEGSFGVKHYDIFAGGIGELQIGNDFIVGAPYNYTPNNILITWYEPLLAWEFSRLAWTYGQPPYKTIINFSTSTAYVNGIPVLSHLDTIITDQTGFNNIFNKDVLGGTNYISTTGTGSSAVRTIYLKKGTYELRNLQVIDSNINIISQDEAFIIFNPMLLNSTLITITGEKNDIQLNLNGRGLQITNFIVDNGTDNKFNLYTKDTILTNTLLQVAQNAIIKSEILNVISYADMKDINNSIMYGDFDKATTKTFNNCNNNVVLGLNSGNSIIGTGNFDF